MKVLDLIEIARGFGTRTYEKVDMLNDKFQQ